MNQDVAFLCHTVVRGCQLQMIALAGIGHAAPRQECPPQKCRPAAWLLHHRQVDVQGAGLLPVKTEGIHNRRQLLAGLNLKHLLAAFALAGLAVKAQAKGFLKQLWQQDGKVVAFSDNFNRIIAEAVAKQQNSKAFGQRTATRRGAFTHLRFCRRRK